MNSLWAFLKNQNSRNTEMEPLRVLFYATSAFCVSHLGTWSWNDLLTEFPDRAGYIYTLFYGTFLSSVIAIYLSHLFAVRLLVVVFVAALALQLKVLYGVPWTTFWSLLACFFAISSRPHPLWQVCGGYLCAIALKSLVAFLTSPPDWQLASSLQSQLVFLARVQVDPQPIKSLLAHQSWLMQPLWLLLLLTFLVAPLLVSLQIGRRLLLVTMVTLQLIMLYAFKWSLSVWLALGLTLLILIMKKPELAPQPVGKSKS